MSLEYVPAPGKVAVQILDDIDGDDEQDARSSSGAPSAVDSYSDEALIAICMGVGPKVTACKTGDTIYVYPWAQDGVKLGDGVRIIEEYCVAAKVKK